MRRPIALCPGQKRSATLRVTMTAVLSTPISDEREVAAVDEAHAERVEIARRDAVLIRARAIGGVDARLPFGRIEDRARRRRAAPTMVRPALLDAGQSRAAIEQGRADLAPAAGADAGVAAPSAGAAGGSGSCTRSVSTPSARKPGSKSSSAAKLRPRSAAPTSSATATATSPITIMRSVDTRPAPRAATAPSRSDCDSDPPTRGRAA